jgi:hypothetical protein
MAINGIQELHAAAQETISGEMKFFNSKVSMYV